MFINVYMTDTRDGKEYIYEDNFDWSELGKPGILYQWLEGNYSCDCNRSLFVDVNEDLPCSVSGENIMRLDKIIDRDNNDIIYPEPLTQAEQDEADYPKLHSAGFVIIR